MPVIVRVTEQGRSKAHRFSDSVERILIGRGEQCDIQIDEGRASRAHCQIQRSAQGTWKLVDLESRNGTKVDGLMVNAHALTGQETITIGTTTIHFEPAGAPPAAAPVARPAAPVARPRPAAPVAAIPIIEDDAPIGAPAAAPVPPPALAIGGTIQMSRPPSARLAQRKSSNGLVVLGAVAAVLLLILFGVMELNAHVKRKAQIESAWAVAKQAEDAATHAPAGKIGDAVAAAQERFRRFARDYPDAPTADAALAAARRLGEQQKSVLHWERVLNAVANEQKVLEPTFDRLADWHQRLVALGGSAPHEGIGAEVAAVLGEVKSQLDRFEVDRVAEVQRLAAADAEAGEFSRARNRLRAVLSARPPLRPENRQKIEGDLVQIQGAAETAFARDVAGPVEDFIANEAYDEAKRRLQEALKRFRGFETIELKADIKVRLISVLRAGGMKTAAAESMFKSREEVYKAAIEADQHARERRFDDAITAYEQIVEASDLREVKAEFQAKIEDCRRQQALWQRFLTDANAGAFQSTPWQMPTRGGAPMAATITGADAEGLTLQVGGARVRRRWTDLDATAFLSVLRVPKLSLDEELAWVLFAYQLDQNEAGEQALVALAGREPGRADDIQVLVSRLRKEPLPSGGYVVFDGRFVSREQRGSMQANASLNALVAAVRNASAEALPAAVAKLAASPEGKPLAVSVLQERVQTLVSGLDKVLGPLGAKKDPQLVALRDELDKRRQHALTLIWDIKEYPDKKTADPDFYRRADDEVHRRIATVTEIWENPYKSKSAIHPKAAEIQGQLTACDRLLAQYSDGKAGGTAPRHDPGYLARFAGRPLTVQTYARDWREEYVINYSHQVLEINAKLQTMAGDQERKQVEITNEYRMMMFMGPKGSPARPDASAFEQFVPAVLIHDKLVQSARWHSEYMAKSGDFGHVLPGHPHGDSPFDRMKNAGYEGNGSENIHMGRGDPRGAHLSWLHSANHHRNILTPLWRSLGVGNESKYWTQNFGNQRPDLPEFRRPAAGSGKRRR